MKISGERIIIFGDSLSHHGDDNAPEIWDVDQGSSRITSQPGDLLASLLAEQGAVVRIDANVGRSAHNFWYQPHPRFQFTDPQDLFASDRLFAPTLVFVMLGTNDIGLNLAIDAQDMQRIRDAYLRMGARDVWAIGPPIFANASMNAQAEPVYGMLRNVFGADHVIDARPLSSTTNRARDGVHFQPASAANFAYGLLDAIATQGPSVPVAVPPGPEPAPQPMPAPQPLPTPAPQPVPQPLPAPPMPQPAPVPIPVPLPVPRPATRPIPLPAPPRPVLQPAPSRIVVPKPRLPIGEFLLGFVAIASISAFGYAAWYFARRQRPVIARR